MQFSLSFCASGLTIAWGSGLAQAICAVTADWSRGKFLHMDSCPACDSTSASRAYERRDDALNMPDVWTYHLCADCRSLYLVDRPDDESLPRAYADYYTHQAQHDRTSTGTGTAVRLVNGYLNARYGMGRANALAFGHWLFRVLPPLRMKLDVYARHVPARYIQDGARLLDVGCGSGDFLLRAREMGLQAHGFEPDDVAVATCREQGLDVQVGDLQTVDNAQAKFDYITLNHVIEHVTNPQESIKRLHALLTPGGRLWMALPNPNALGRSWFKQGWKGFHPPYHLLIPSQRVLRMWLDAAGFEEVSVIRRGVQSPGLWRESIEIAMRENTAPSALLTKCVWRLADVLSSVSPRWGEETIITARRTEDKDVD